MRAKKFLPVVLTVLFVLAASFGYAKMPRTDAGLSGSNSPSAEQAARQIHSFIESDTWKDFQALLNTNVSESLKDIAKSARESEKLDFGALLESAITGDTADTTASGDSSSKTASPSASSTDSASQEDASAKAAAQTASALSKSSDTMVASVERIVYKVADVLPDWIPGREYLVIFAVLTMLVWAIFMTNKYLK